MKIILRARVFSLKRRERERKIWDGFLDVRVGY